MIKKKRQVSPILIIYSAVCMIMSAIAMINISLQGGTFSELLVFGSLMPIMGLAIILTKKSFYISAKYIACLAPGYFFLTASIFAKTSGHLNNTFFYLLPRMFVLFTLMTPILFFGYRDKKRMKISFACMIPSVFFFDYIHDYFGVHFKELPYIHSFYPLFIFFFILVYSIPLISLFFFQKTTISFKKQIIKKSQEIIKEKEEVVKLNHLLQFQANLYKILNITSQNTSLEVILQKVLDRLLKSNTFDKDSKGVIYLTNPNGSLTASVQQNYKDHQKKNLFEYKNGDAFIEDNNRYIIPILNKKQILGVIVTYINSSVEKDKNTTNYLEAIADILARKILSTKRISILAKKNIEIEANKNILQSTHQELTDSINYAESLQTSLLPNQNSLNQFLNDTSVLFLPRNGISGDFYFAYEIEEYIYFGVGDCTGHGIPGAFLAAMSTEAVKTVLYENIGKKPDLLLEKLRDIAKSRFTINEKGQHHDSMDAGFCMLDKASNKLYFSGGFINLIIARNEKILEFDSTRCPIGSYPLELPFALYEIQIQKNDVLYLATDGYTDQFGSDPLQVVKKQKKYKRKRFKNLILNLKDLSSEQQVKELRSDIKSWQGEEEQVDDITVLIARF